MGLIYYLESPEYLDILGKYFNVSEFIEDDTSGFEILGEYEGVGEIYIYNSEETGRILVMTHTEGVTYDELLLFSPLGTSETSSKNSTFNSDEVTMIIEKILKKNRDFRNKLIEEFCRSRERFNINFKDFFNIDFNFFLQCEAVAEINPLCSDRNSFKNCVDIIYSAMTCNQETKILLKKEKGEIKSVKALKELFEKAGKIDDVASNLKDMKAILLLRNAAPAHSTNTPFFKFLKRFNKKYPDPKNPEEWCDLSIFTLQKISKILNELSNVLSQ